MSSAKRPPAAPAKTGTPAKKPAASPAAPKPGLEIKIVRRFAAPRALVFQNWVEAAALKHWFAPDTFDVTRAEAEARPGGRWRVEYRARSGATFTENGSYQEIQAPERLVMTLTQEMPGHKHPETVITVTFKDLGRGTEMMFHQTGFESRDRRDGNAEGWEECFARLATRMAA